MPKIITNPNQIKLNDRLTVWASPHAKFPTQWGFISYGDWCEREARRRNRNGARSVAVTWSASSGDMVCVAKNVE